MGLFKRILTGMTTERDVPLTAAFIVGALIAGLTLGLLAGLIISL